jgi:6-phosphogluconolactonase
MLCHAAFSATAGAERFYIGTYTSDTSQGIYQSSLDLGSGTVGPTNLAGAAANPSYVVLHPSGNFLYAVNEETGGYVVAFSVNRTNGTLTQLNQQPSQGDSPCHLAIDSAGRNVMVANYASGSVTVFPIQTNGQLGAATAHIQHPGSSPHAHCSVFDASNQYVLVCDLGLDRIFCYQFNSLQGTLATNSIPWTSVTTGAGPRHLAFDPQFRRAYVLCQLNSTIVSFNYDSTNGVLNPFQTNSSLPSGWTGDNAAAEIAVHPSGRFLYASNRGFNSIAVFAIDPATGLLTPVQQQSVGTTPRQFAIDPTGAFCIVADQDSNDIRIYAVDLQTGLLTPNGQMLYVSQPVCILPLITQPPQPVLTLQSTATNTLQINVGNALDLLSYNLEQAPCLPPATNWTPLASGLRGQTNFILTSSVPQNFFRVSVTTNF